MVAVGVTGHRDIQYSAKISHAIDSVLSHIQSIYGHTSLQLISPLAEGADRLVAWQAIESYSARLIVPLPMETTEYMQDFKTSASKTEFQNLIDLADQVIQLPPENSRAASYLAAGRYTLHQSDVIIAIWDGRYNGRMGGTGQIVTEARQQGVPMVWIQVEDRGEGGENSLRGDRDGKIRIQYERFPPLKNKAGHK